jgi:hypothetical protein
MRRGRVGAVEAHSGAAGRLMRRASGRVNKGRINGRNEISDQQRDTHWTFVTYKRTSTSPAVLICSNDRGLMASVTCVSLRRR